MMQYPVTHRLQSSQASMYNQVIVGENSQTTMLNTSLFFILFYSIFFPLNIMFCVIYCTGVTLTMAWNGLDGCRCPAVPVHLLYIRVYIYIYIFLFLIFFIFFYLPLISSWRNLKSNTVTKLFLCICLYITTLLSLSYCWQHISKWMNWKCWHVNVYNHNAVLKILLAIY